MQDPLAYTKENLEQELNLLEIHLKEAPVSDEAFCKDCCDKHLSTISGYSSEGLSFTDNKKEIKTFLDIAKTAKEMRKRDYKKEGIQMSQEIRALRKQLSDCPLCKNNPSSNPKSKLLMPVSEIESLAGFRRIAIHGGKDQYYDLNFANDEYFISDEGVVIWRSSDNFPDLAKDKWKQLTGEDLSYKKIAKIKNSPKDLNSSLSKDKNNPIKSQKGGMISMVSKEEAKKLGIINAGALLGKSVQVAADWIDTKMPAPTVGLPVAAEWYKRPSTYITLGGGIALQLLALYGIKNPNTSLLVTVAGANMVTKAIDIGKEALTETTPTPTVGARLPLFGRTSITDV